MTSSPESPSRTPPIQTDDPRVATLVAYLPLQALESWEERAAIRQYDAGYTKRDAEVEALLDVLVSWAPLRVGTVWPRLFQHETPSGTEWLLCCDVQRLAVLNLNDIPAEVGLLGELAEKFGGVAILQPAL